MDQIRESIKAIFTPITEMGEKDYSALIDEIGEMLSDARDANIPLSDFADPEDVLNWKREILDDEIVFAADVKDTRLGWEAEDVAEVLNLLGLYEFVEGKTSRGVRDGTGPYKGSARGSVFKIGRRKQAGEPCLKGKKVAEGVEELEGSELLDKYIEQQNMYHFEGDTGVRNLEQVMSILGYGGIYEFLADNPGAQSGIIEWISEWADRNSEWKEALLAEVDVDRGDEE